tara:strand:+ start:213 stop:506 length:294 start_codon:yes stop_codon:yes gene_type:complete
MEKGDFRDEEKPIKITTKRELRGQLEKMKCCECDSVGIYWNEKRNLYYCQEHNPRKPIAEEFALKPIPRDKRNTSTTSKSFREMVLKRKSMMAKQYE